MRLASVAIENHEVASRLVHPCHDGLRLAHLSDLHVSANLPARRLLRMVELVNARRPDFALLTGDYVNLTVRALPRLVDALSRLEVPSWGVLGNHDHWADAARVTAALERSGVRVLRNSSSTLEVFGAPLHLVGVDDYRTGHADAAMAFEGLPVLGTRLVLTHDPNAADALHGRGAALVLAGHTHGGQIRLPRVTEGIARWIGVKYLAGFFRVGDGWLYVNRGLGAVVPLRVAAPRELAFITLRAACARG
jgi:predicted MPP superfamily phosphohydrolase